MHSVSTVRFLVVCGLITAVQFSAVATEVSECSLEKLITQLESRINERLELLSQKVDSVIHNVERSTTKSIESLETKVKELENTNNRIFEITQSNITQLSAQVEAKAVTSAGNSGWNCTSIDYLSAFGAKLANHLELRVQQITLPAGVYYWNHPKSSSIPFKTYREGWHSYALGGGWTVFQRRINGSLSFNRNYTEYYSGFGDVGGEHWLGLRYLHDMLKTGRHELLIELEYTFGQIRHAMYDDFQLGDYSENFQIKSLGNFSGSAFERFKNKIGKKFVTFEQKNTSNHESSCSGGWWFDECSPMQLNGRYHIYKVNERHLDQSFKLINAGIQWYHRDSIKSTKMMVRPYLPPVFDYKHSNDKFFEAKYIKPSS